MYERRAVVSREEKQVHLDRLRDEILGRIKSRSLSPYGLAMQTGIDYMTIKRVLKAEGCQYWTAEVIRETLTKLEQSDERPDQQAAGAPPGN